MVVVGEALHQFMEGEPHARQRNSPGPVSEQSVYNLLERTVELEVLPACRDYGIGLLPNSPLHGGLLGGAVRRGTADGRMAEPKSGKQLKRHHDRIAAYEKWCADLGLPPAQVALAWLLHQPGVTAPSRVHAWPNSSTRVSQR